MKKIRTEEAVGHVLCHDITQIIKGVSKGPVFRKGHVIQEEDIPVLLSVGKEHVYIWECDDSTLHENDAAAILRDISLGANMHATEAKEGKIELVADCDGLLTIRRQGLQAVNSLGEMMMIFANMKKINHALSLINGAAQLQENWYWTSTEASSTNAWNLHLSNGYASRWATKASGQGRIRPVSAFLN